MEKQRNQTGGGITPDEAMGIISREESASRYYTEAMDMFKAVYQKFTEGGEENPAKTFDPLPVWAVFVAGYMRGQEAREVQSEEGSGSGRSRKKGRSMTHGNEAVREYRRERKINRESKRLYEMALQYGAEYTDERGKAIAIKAFMEGYTIGAVETEDEMERQGKRK